jgi:Zn-dependent peptidase ImmA (M78 family)/DNA-binding XRE family transcriptional regulator
MEKKINFRNLLLARESRGITQKKMSENIECLSQGNLSRMEKGLMEISKETLIQIAEYLDYPISFFYKESQNRELNTFFYRKRVTIPSKEITKLEAKFDLARIAIDELLDSVDIPDFTIPSIPVSENITPENIANRIRIFLALPKGPIDLLINKIEQKGVIIIMLKDAPDKFFGVTMFTNKVQPIIFINGNLSNDAKRFTIGHELGHLVMHLRENTFQEEDKKLDKEADVFSSEFNMPSDECRSDLIRLKYSDLPSVKTYWKLSKAAICYKAKSMGFLSDSQYKYFMMQLSSSGQRKKENECVDIDSPTLLNKIINVHLFDLQYTKEEFSDLIGLSKDDIDNWFYFQQTLVKPKMRIIKKIG